MPMNDGCRDTEHVAAPEESLAGVERGRAARSDAAEPIRVRAGGAGGQGDRVAGGRRRAELFGRGAARRAGRRDGDTVAAWVARFNREGLAAVRPGHGGRPTLRYGDEQQRRILAEARRAPDRERDGTATWSLSTLQRALRRAEDGLPTISTDTIWRTLHEAGLSWQKSRTWCAAGTVVRPRRHGGAVTVTDIDAAAKKLERRSWLAVDLLREWPGGDRRWPGRRRVRRRIASRCSRPFTGLA